jgi:hypothetical protein
LDENRQGGGVAMQKVLMPNRSYLPIAKESGQSNGANLFLNVPGVVIWLAEKAVPPAIATAKTRAVYGSVFDLLSELLQQARHVFGTRPRIPTLELDGLPGARVGTDGNRSRFRVGANEIANQKIATMKLLKVFVDDKSDKKISTRLLLFLGGQMAERLGQDFVGGTVADFVNEIAFSPGNGPSVANRRASL